MHVLSWDDALVMGRFCPCNGTRPLKVVERAFAVAESAVGIIALGGFGLFMASNVLMSFSMNIPSSCVDIYFSFTVYA